MKATSSISSSTLLESLNPVLAGAIPYTAVDPAGGKESLKGDMSVIVTGFVKRYAGGDVRLWVVEALGGRWKPLVLLDNLFNTATKWRPRQIIIEENVGKEYLKTVVATHSRSLSVHLPIVWVTSSLYGTGKKVTRIESLHAPYKYHQISHAIELKGSEFERQILYWTPEGKGLDDFPDCLALLWLFVNRMGIATGAIREVTKRSEREREPTYSSTQV